LADAGVSLKIGLMPTFDLSAVDPQAQLDDLNRADYQESLYEFYKAAWPLIDTSPWMDGWAIDAIAEHLQAVCDGEINRLCINVSPRTGKSNLISVAFDAWVWAQPHAGPISGPAVKFLHASYANQLSLRDNVKCRRLIESSWYQKLWGHRFQLTTDQNTKSRFANDQGGERLITSIEGTNTGEGAMCFVAGTLVNTPHGNIPIEKLLVGNTVYSSGEGFEAIRESRIVAVMARKPYHGLVTISCGGSHSLTCTVDHRIYTVRDGYQRADSLKTGTRVLCYSHLGFTYETEVESVNSVTADYRQLVYDIQVERDHNFFAEGVLVSNCIIIDDPNAVDDVDSEATIQAAIDWWDGVMPTRLNNQETGAYIVIQQRTFENDLTGHIMEHERDDWCWLMIPMRYEPERSFMTPIGWKDPRTVEGELMWPERFSEKAVARLEKRLGKFRAAGQLQQRPEPAGGGIIERAWWQLWESETFPPMDFVLATLDTAYTEDQLNDPSGMIVWGVFSETTSQANHLLDASGNRVYLDRTISESPPRAMMMYAWDDHLKLHDLVKRVAKTCLQYKVDLLLIENKASGISVSQEIRRLISAERFGVQLFDPKSQDKVARLISIQHLFQEGLIYAPSEKYPWVDKVITQVGMFPKAKHDEYVDLTSMGLRHLRNNGLIARAQERLAELEGLKVFRGNQDQPLYPV
jgi:predicted phage terminase large subunit-like protein